ncbi:MAG: hypothetical protein WAT72_02770 [Microgenomates group bacterium]|jgi:hypothetical protein|nr:hypothetical protein [Candidatus Woesebacteria bacterium]
MQHDTTTDFWKYMSQKQKDLIHQGDFIRHEVIEEGKFNFDDYAFMVFPYAKAYEGFLKQLFKDIGFISESDYFSDHLRLGKLMSPHMVGKLGDESLYKKLVDFGTRDLAERMWTSWTEGRNRVFHYFPHNLEAITLEEAEQKKEMILDTMMYAYEQLYPSDSAKV